MKLKIFVILSISIMIITNLFVATIKKDSKEDIMQEEAIFAGGCFWCVESSFEDLPGVIEAISGYTGGHMNNPNYNQVSMGSTDHLEAVKVVYNSSQITYEQLLKVFWKNINPTDAFGQFADRGSQYKTAIFYFNDDQKVSAQKMREILNNSNIYNKPIVIEIIPASTFYPAENYHQDYYKKRPIPYKYYYTNSGRKQFVETIGNNVFQLLNRSNKYTPPPKNQLKEILNDIEFQVTQKNGTEPAFNNKYWNNKKTGIYVDIISGEPLFSSQDKYDSGTGWPSFTKPLESQSIIEKIDTNHNMIRIEVRSKNADSHLGHLFDDGPPPLGKRYCINSAALRFISLDQLREQGYAQYENIFKNAIEQIKR